MARDIVVYSNGDEGVAEKIRAATKGRRVVIEPRKIASLRRKEPGHSEVVVRFSEGDTRTETFLVSTLELLKHRKLV